MLTFHGTEVRGPVDVAPDATTLPDGISWIDALRPSDEEFARLARLVGTRIPTRTDLDEIETSSRLSFEGDALIMSLPGMSKDVDDYPQSTPIGFVTTPRVVVTIRFAGLPAFDHMARLTCEKGNLSPTGLGATIDLIEILVDHIADLLERVGGDLDGMSRSIFAGNLLATKKRRPHTSNQALGDLLRKVGRFGDVISKVSETLLGLSRMAPYIGKKASAQLSPDLKERLDTVVSDTKSLHEFQEHLVNKTQFLLDTLLGLTNIEQNNVFRVLTVVSVVGIPPTLIASIYGMNFKNMPELDWAYGYPWGLSLIAISAIAPALWFKIKGWW